MAKDDVMIDIGVQLDETQFKSSFDNFLQTLKQETATALEDALANVGGSAARNWGSIPYQTMHDATQGAAVASRAFVPGFAKDLQSLGIQTTSAVYEAALLSAAYRSSVPDPFHRFNLLHSYGQDAPTPSSAIEHVLNTDYTMLSQSWSRRFVNVDANNNLVPDFEGMREYAVKEGLGKWISPWKGQSADNFELINNELENITENADKSDKVFRDWNDSLKGALGVLTAIGSLAIGAAGAAAAFNAKAEKGTTQAATTLDRRRAFVGMTALDELSAQVAGQSVGLGKNALTDEIINLSSSREKYKLLGEGLNALYPSLTGIFDNLMNSDNPLEAYKGILRELYSNMLGADDTKRAQTLMLLESQGLGGAAQIIGSFLSNPQLAKDMGNDPTALFSLLNNKYYGAYGRAEALLPDLTQLNASIKSSYAQMYTDWTEAFGEPFKKWWDKTLQNKVVPWFEKILGYINPASENNLLDDVSDTVFQTKVAALNSKVASLNSPYNITSATGWQKAADWAIGTNSTQVIIPSGLGPTSKWGFKTKAGEVAEGINNENPWEFLEALQYATKEDWLGSAWASEGEEENYFKLKSRIALNWLNKTGYKADFNADPNLLDAEQLSKLKATVRVLQAYMASGNYDILETYASGSYLQSPGFEAVAAFLAENKDTIRNDPEKARIVKIQLLDPLGKELPIKVAEDIIGGDFKFESTVNRAN